MRKKDKFLLIILFLLLGLMVLSENNQQKINWAPSFAVQHTIPYGTYIAYHEAKKIFDNRLKPVKTSPYIFLHKNDSAKGIYVLYNTQILLGKTGLKTLLQWVKKGNSVLIAAENIEKDLLDSLRLKEKIVWTATKPSKAVNLQLTNPDLQLKKPAFFDKKVMNISLKPANSTHEFKTSVLGNYTLPNTKSASNFMAIDYGKGKIFLHTFPYFLTNYFILEGNNRQYLAGVFSYLNLYPNIYWDVHNQNGAQDTNLFKYILQNPAFRWAYRLLFLGLFVYIIMEGKRKQPAIPIVTPPKNETLSFTRSIADMYLENNHQTNITGLYIKQFYTLLRDYWHIDTSLNETNIKRQLQHKTSLKVQEIDRLFNLIHKIEQNPAVKTEVLLEIDRLLTQIKNRHS